MKIEDEEMGIRRKAFHNWLATKPFIQERIAKVRPSQQGDIHDAVKMAFNAGYERGIRQERKDNRPIEVGGII